MSKLELEQVQSQYQQALAAIPSLEQRIAAQENLIAVLRGRNPSPIPRGQDDRSACDSRHPCRSAVVIARTPSRYLASRAGYRRCQRGYRRRPRAVLPAVSLTGSLGSISAALSNFLTGPSLAWSVTAGLVGPLFTAGSIAGQVASAEATSAAALATYQQTVFDAFRETNDALTGTVRKRQESAAQARRVASLREYARLSRVRFNNGYAAISKCCTRRTSCSRRSSRPSVVRGRVHAARRRLQSDGRRLDRPR